MVTQFNELTDSQWEVIKEFLPTQRKRKLELRKVIDSILWVVRTGTQWRNLPYCRLCPYKWQSVYYYFYKWTKDGTFEVINTATNYHERKRVGKLSDPSLMCADSQSIKLAPMIFEDRGIHGGKKINGRSRQILVDTLGLVWCTAVHAANIADTVGGCHLIDKVHHCVSRLKKIIVDKGYKKQFMEYTTKHLPDVEIEVSSKPPGVKGFQLLPKRWVAERTFGCFNFFRRLVIDHEHSPRCAESMILLANISMNHPLSVCFGTHNKKQIYCAKCGLKLAINSGTRFRQ